MANWMNRLFSGKKLAEVPAKQIEILDARGSSGTSIYSGYFQEEYLSELTGKDAAEVYDEMRRGDSRVRMVLSAVKNPIKGATWEVHPGDEGAEFEAPKELVHHVLFHGLGKPWREQLSEILSFIDFGHSIFEIVDAPMMNTQELGSYSGIAQLGFRSPKTIYSWNLDKATGKLLGVEQIVNGDLDRHVVIPAENLLVFTHEKEGDNYEGVSGLRQCYGPWFRKKLYLKLMAIGIERNAVPTPKVKFPAGFQSTEQFAQLANNLKALTSHQQNYIMYPDGIEIDFNQNNFSADQTKMAIEFENKEMTFAFLAHFLELGMGTGGGSYALGNDLSDFFLGGIEHLAGIVCEKINCELIPRIVDRNFGPQAKYPKLVCTGISDKAGKEFAEMLGIMAQNKYIQPDDRLEENLRKRMKLPDATEEGRRVPEPKEPAPGEPPPEGDGPIPVKKLMEGSKKKSFSLADKKKPKKLIASARDRLLPLMRETLTDVADDFVSRITKSWDKAIPSQKVNAHKNIHPTGRNAYVAEMNDWLAEIATIAIKDVRRDVPQAKDVRLSEFDRLAKRTQKKIKATSQLIVDTQFADLEKAIYWKFQSNAEAVMGSAVLLEEELNIAADLFIESGAISAAAGNVAGAIVNEARNAFFFDDDVLEEVESFTFVNGDPVSDICQDLAGRTFSKNDAEAERYFPPLHHNCKSFIVANPKGSNVEIDPRGLKPSTAELEASIQFSDCCGAKPKK